MTISPILATAASRRPALGRLANLLRQVGRVARQHPLGLASVVIILLFAAMALIAPLLVPYDPLEMRQAERLLPPSAHHLLGTDNFGRDVLSRILYGARVPFTVGIMSVLLGTSTGAFLGLSSGYFKGNMDILLQRLFDSMMAFPTLVLALTLVSALGASVPNVIVAIAIVQIPRSARVVRSAALSASAAEYVASAQAIGANHGRILVRHVLPNCLAPYWVYSTGEIAHAILIEATLGFLGLGTPPPTPSWGAMLAGAGRSFAESAPWIAFFPGLALSLTVLAFNLAGDSLRDAMDPRLHK